MAAAGLGSRRALEQHIRDGSILLNGKPATLGISVRDGDRLQWDEREWQVSGENLQHRTLVYNKPEGEITSRSDPEGRPTVFDNMPFLRDSRWVAIGRLDINTTGLLLLTTDGELAHAMMHPSNQVDREYICRVRGLVSDENIEQLKTGVLLDDGMAHFNDVQRMGGTGANQWYQVTLLEGRNREVRRLWEAMEHMVSRLKRVRYGAALLPKGLKVGRYHEISPRDHRVLREDVGLVEAGSELVLQAIHKPGQQGRKGAKTRGRKTPGAKPASASRHQNKRHGDGSRPDRQRVDKPGSPAGGGRRPHPKSRRSGK